MLFVFYTLSMPTGWSEVKHYRPKVLAKHRQKGRLASKTSKRRSGGGETTSKTISRHAWSGRQSPTRKPTTLRLLF